MKRPTLTDLGRDLVIFFDDFLSSQRGLSPHTIRSYRDTIVLWLQFTARETRRGVEQFTIRDLTEERVARFLRFLEIERKNTIATRNARLGSIHVFARFLAGRHPDQLGTLQRVIGLPFKNGARDAPIEYLERAEIEALLKSIDRRTALGRRDYTLFALMFNTGARVQEVLNLRRRDLRLEAPCQVRLLGKGSKVRICPLWPVTARLLSEQIAQSRHCDPDAGSTFVFLNARGSALTRYGVRYLLRRYAARAARLVPTLKDKNLHPHSIRHSTAIALLKAGVTSPPSVSGWGMPVSTQPCAMLGLIST